MPLSVSVKLYNNTPAAPNLNVTLNISWSISDSYNITHIQLLIGRELESPSHSYNVEAHLKSFFINIARLEKDAYLWVRQGNYQLFFNRLKLGKKYKRRGRCEQLE